MEIFSVALHEEAQVCLCVGGLLRTAGILTQEMMSEARAREICRWMTKSQQYLRELLSVSVSMHGLEWTLIVLISARTGWIVEKTIRANYNIFYLHFLNKKNMSHAMTKNSCSAGSLCEVSFPLFFFDGLTICLSVSLHSSSDARRYCVLSKCHL